MIDSCQLLLPLKSIRGLTHSHGLRAIALAIAVVSATPCYSQEASTEDMAEEYLAASVSGQMNAAVLAESRAIVISRLAGDLRRYLISTTLGDQARARRACLKLKEIARADEIGAHQEILAALSNFSASAFQDPAKLHILAPILCLRTELGDSSSLAEQRSIAFRHDTPASVRLELARGLELPEDAQVLKMLKEVLSSPGESVTDRIEAARLLIEAGDDREALQYGLRLARGECDPQDSAEGTRSADGYSLLCQIADKDASTFQVILTDLTSVNDLFGARVILAAFDGDLLRDDSRRTQISAAVRNYIEKVLECELEADWGNIRAAFSVLRNAGVIAEAEISALERKVDDRFASMPVEGVSSIVVLPKSSDLSELPPAPGDQEPTPGGVHSQPAPNHVDVSASSMSETPGRKGWSLTVSGLAAAICAALVLLRVRTR